MPTKPKDEAMTIDERRKYLRTMQKRYLRADRPGRGVLLTEMEAVTQLGRKYLTRLMHGDLARRPHRTPRGRSYGVEVDDALRVIVESFDRLTPERLTPNLVWMAECLAAHGELILTPPLVAQLEAISPSTVGRILARLGQDTPTLPRKGPQEANRWRREVPMRRIPWNEQEPGHFEADLVHHCGSATTGDYVHTLQLIDVATAWSERVAVLGRSFRVMRDAFHHILTRLPFGLREIHPDNGGEFFSHHLLTFWGERIHGLTLSRSRPWQKNDNRFVEQKNDTLVRGYLGHERLDSVAQTRALNTLYEDLWTYYNFFQPVMRLVEKEVLRDEEGRTRVRRRYDTARTPLDRLLATDTLPPAQHEKLLRQREGINPRRLHQSIQDQLEALWRLPGAPPTQTENIYATLLHPELLAEEEAMG
jgi:hypothetical protein